MIRARLSVLAALLCFALLAGCERSDRSSKEPATAAKPGAMAEVTATPAEPAQPTQTVAAKQEGEQHDCSGMKPGEECSGGCDQWNEAAAAVTERDVPKDAEWKTLAVEGMTCAGCEQRIIANVGTIDGIYAVEADAELGQVRVAMAKGKAELQKQAVDKISSLGYRVQ